jgi:excisionase family DNA binding protein
METKKMQETKNLTIEQVARWLEVNPKTIYRLVQKGGIPGFKVGGQWRFNEKMLKEWMTDQVTAERRRVEDTKEKGSREGHKV